MKYADIRSNHTLLRGLRIAFRLLIALLISLGLTVSCIAYIPSVFTSTLNTGLEMLPKYKFLQYKVQTTSELVEDLLISEPPESDEALFRLLRKELPDSRDKSTFFARMFVIHDYPQRCQYVVIGKHRTMDLTWQVRGLRCEGKKSCEQARLYQICRDKKEPQHERHH